MTTNRYNSTNTLGTTQPFSNSATVTPNTTFTNFPRPSGLTITVTRLNAAMAAAGAAVGDVVERDSDGGFWDTTASCTVPCDYTSLQTGNDMISN